MKVLRYILLTMGFAFIGVAAAALIFWFSFKQPGSTAPKQFWNITLAHRGGEYGSPENSLSAVRKVASLGIKALEIDAHLSKDKIPIVFHDDTLERTSTGQGHIADFIWSELESLNLKDHQGSVVYSEKIPTLEQLVVLAKNLELILEVDVRPEISDPREMARKVSDLFKKHDLYDWVFVSSFHPIFIYYLRSENPAIVTAFAMRPNATGNPLIDLLLTSDTIIDFLGVAIIEPHKKMVTEAFVEKWLTKNIHINAWTINETKEKEYYKKFPISITTNCPIGICHDNLSDQL